MNKRLKRRLFAVTGVVVIVVVVVLAIVAGASAAKTLTVEQAATGDFNGSRVEITGEVVDNSFSYEGDVLTFAIYDKEGAKDKTLKVVYDRGVTSAFGNQITATCTGMIDSDGILRCSELVTQCPSKYEGSTDALSVTQLSTYGQEVIGKPIKVTGTIKAGTMTSAGKGDRFVIVDTDGKTELSVKFDGALSEEVTDGAVVVLSGALESMDRLQATDVALRQ